MQVVTEDDIPLGHQYELAFYPPLARPRPKWGWGANITGRRDVMRDDRIMFHRRNGATYAQLSELFGLSIGRLRQIVQREQRAK